MTYAREGSTSGNLVHIENADSESIYFCPEGHEVRPIQGNEMPWHYRHISERECAYLQVHPGDGWNPPD